MHVYIVPMKSSPSAYQVPTNQPLCCCLFPHPSLVAMSSLLSTIPNMYINDACVDLPMKISSPPLATYLMHGLSTSIYITGTYRQLLLVRHVFYLSSGKCKLSTQALLSSSISMHHNSSCSLLHYQFQAAGEPSTGPIMYVDQKWFTPIIYIHPLDRWHVIVSPLIYTASTTLACMPCVILPPGARADNAYCSLSMLMNEWLLY